MYRGKLIEIKQPNILIDEDSHIRVSDYGLSGSRGPIATSVVMDKSTSAGWLAPELFDETSSASFEADIYAFTCVWLEVRNVLMFQCEARFLILHRYVHSARQCLISLTHKLS